MSGKGDKRRPNSTSTKEFDIRWELAFGKKDKTEQDLKEHIQATRPSPRIA